jgi:hypothetical protein
MRAYAHKRVSGRIEFGIIYGAIALLAIGAARIPQIITLPPSCAFKGLTGIPCPTCGSTRAVLHLSHGDILASLVFNPLTSLCFLAAVLYFLYSLVTLAPGIPRIGLAFSVEEKNALRIGAVMLVLMNWMYLIFTL